MSSVYVDVATDQDMICDDVEDSEAAEPPEDSELPGAPKDTEAALPADQTQDNRYDDDINETRITDQRGRLLLFSLLFSQNQTFYIYRITYFHCI